MALGALIIKEKLEISDREKVEKIKENPYLPYFIGLSGYRNPAPFDASMLVHFRTRINVDLVNKVNQVMVNRMREVRREPVAENQSEVEEISDIKSGSITVIESECQP